jgi:hypothetical protein
MQVPPKQTQPASKANQRSVFQVGWGVVGRGGVEEVVGANSTNSSSKLE